MFIFEVEGVDMARLLMIALLTLSGVIEPSQAISGLSPNTVVSIIAIIIVDDSLDKTCIMNIFARYIIKFAGKSKARIMTLISGAVAFISNFMQNIGATALFLPIINRICRQLNVPVSRILISM